MGQGRSLAPLWWLACVAPALALLVLSARGPLAGVTWHSPLTLFWLAVVGASLCVAVAVAVIAIGWWRGLGEVAMLGSAVLAVSLLPLVHGLTTPGVLYGANSATLVAAFLAVPVAVLVAAPVILPDLAPLRGLSVRWRLWTVASICASIGLAALLLARPDALPPPVVGRVETYAAIAVSLLGTLALSLRHLRLHRIGGRGASFVASVGLMYIGLSSLVWIVEQPFSLSWWAAHVIDITGVFAALFGLGFAHYRDRSVASILAPVVNRDPLIALELGLTPTVHEVFTPDAILKKPGALSNAEFETVKEHTIWGFELMRTSPLLAPAAHLVRWHHERPDGSGYPDRRSEADLPEEVGIVSVCDALDAMTSTRQYRAGMRHDAAIEILRDGAGSQWSTRAVGLVLDELSERGIPAAPAFGAIGTEADRDARASGEQLVEACIGALPERARAQLGLDAR